MLVPPLRRPRALCLAPLLFLLSGCKDKPEQPPANKSAPSVVPEPSEPAAPPAPTEVTRVALTAADFSTDQVLEELSPEAPRITAEVAPTPFNPEREETAKHPQKRFTRVKGGNDFYCGATVEGPIECWGKRKETVQGQFIDLAIAGDELCWIDSSHRLSCDKTKAPSGEFARVQASGKNFCALEKSGSVQCWGKDSTPPLPGLSAKFIAVGDRFACAADITRRLVCWGETPPLMLPTDPLRVRDIAAGAGFLCALNEDNEVQCFGKGPRLPEGRYTTLNAAYDQLCGIDVDAKNLCEGTVSSTLRGQTRRFAIAKSSVCAHLMKNELLCEGSQASGQLNIPRDRSRRLDKSGESSPAIDGETWLKFIELFPEQKAPLEFTLTSEVTLGDRLPVEFEPLIGEDPNRYRTGVGFEFPGGVLGFTLFDLKERVLLLFLFRDRKKVESFALLKNIRTESALEEADDGTAIQNKTAVTRESILTKDLTIEVTERRGTEKAKFVKKHQDGKRPVSSIDCQIQKSTWVSTVGDKGKSNRLQAQVKREYGAIDGKGCAGRAPFL